MKYLGYLCLILFFPCTVLAAHQTNIDHFLVKENLLKNNKLAIIAADSAGNALEHISGIYTFSVSGFSQELNFHGGVAVIPQKIDKSTFVYLKHENLSGVHSRLVYVYKKENNLRPIVINRVFLVVVPLLLLLLVFAFKRFIYIGAFLLIAFILFNHFHGLNVSTFFETTFDYLKNLI